MLTSTPELSRGGGQVEGLGVRHLSQLSVVGSGILMILSGRCRGWQSGGVPPKGVVAALPATPPVRLGGDRGACPRSSDIGAGPQVCHAHLYPPVSMLEKQYFPSTFGDGDLHQGMTGDTKSRDL